MGLGTLREKQLVKLSGRTFRLDTLLGNGNWCMTDLDTGLVDQKSVVSLWAAHESGELRFISSQAKTPNRPLEWAVHETFEAAVVAPSKHVFEDIHGEIGAMRARYVEAIRGKSRTGCIKVIADMWKELNWPDSPPGFSTVMRWKHKSNGHSDPVRALRDRSARKGRHGHRCDPVVLDILRDVRDNHYLSSQPRISLQRAVQIAGDKVRITNATRPSGSRFAIPKRKAMASVVREIDAGEVLAARFGADKALAMLRTSLGGVKTSRPLERVEIDHTVLSIILLDDDFEPIGRAFITLAKDAHTRSVLGYYWGAEHPSIVSLARCIRHSVQPKLEFLKRYPDIKCDWPCFGAAESWVIDNGLEEHASALHQAASESGVQKVEFCGRISPWQKPHIERYFRTQDQGLIHGLPGTTMENITKRTDFDPKKDMLIRWSTFDKLLAKWIVDVYMQQPQKILRNRSPYRAWIEAIGEFTQFVPESTAILECLFLRQVDGRSLDHEGVEFDCLIYNSLDMKVLRSKFGAKLKVNIRVDDECLEHIYVQVPTYDIWIKVPCLDLEYSSGLTRWQHEKCKKMRRVCAEDGAELTLAEARQQILADIAAEKSAVTQGRKKQRARMMERSRTSSARSQASEQAPPIETTHSDLPDDLASNDSETCDVEVFERGDHQ